MADFTVLKRGTDSSGRGIYATTYMWDWWQGVLSRLPFGSKVVITQGAFMTKAGGGASGSAGYHDLGGSFDLRVWNLTDEEVGHLVRELRRSGAAAWLRNMEHGGFADPHIHFVLGSDKPLTQGAAFQWAEYKAGRSGLASMGADYHWRPDPLVLTPPKAAPPKPPKPPARLRLVSFNVYQGQRGLKLRRNLRKLMRDTDFPDVIALQEARGLKTGFLRYRRLALGKGAGTEAGQQVILVRRRPAAKVIRRRILRVGGPKWRGPQKGLHDSRTFLGATVEVRGWRWEILNVHRAWTGGGKRNMDAWRAEHRALVQFADDIARSNPNRALVMPGDYNGRESDDNPTSVTALAERIDGEAMLRGIDGAIVRNCDGRARKLAEKYGSDGHHPVLITLTKESN